MRPLTERQAQILDLIKQSIVNTGMPPTRAEIATRLGFRSANAAEDHLKALAKKGFIEILPGTSRGIRLTEDISQMETGLPVIGKVAAGSPILAMEHVDSHINVDPTMFNPAADFLLKVEGESMRDIGIMDGDFLAVHKTQTARDGQVVVARVEEDVTVKRLERNGSQVILHAENKEFSPIKVDLNYQDFAIEGLAVGVIRNSSLM
ncbi:transcriptional repressor LexA [Psychrosphaera sp. B3R10]|uniref:transcriptional repressor LexA n=1 Tax=unclassified Psychrosphaera TaxID=2641570 RepID=UPI001C092D0D|nr:MULTISPECIES: transcriptional repressor LexA [unclassified Psychrosphaera]MBU2880608.1 transcriptional repressor LexA [Psychrosphaera sp. I2R16]MBU2990694.1 transcriptional repressor LexA [Psychrosphaera sp. B3R10]MDO6720815.1 transcriptional repressor LexA [Psychrosphaera sp. 1_MG-2023]